MRFNAEIELQTDPQSGELLATVRATPASQPPNQSSSDKLDRGSLVGAILIIALWVIGLSWVGHWTWVVKIGGVTRLEDYRFFLLVTALSGAIGALGVVIFHLHRYYYSKSRPNVPSWVPINNLVVKPILWPVAAAVFAPVIPFIVYGLDGNPLRVCIVALASGAMWPSVLLKVIPGLARQ